MLQVRIKTPNLFKAKAMHALLLLMRTLTVKHLPGTQSLGKRWW